MQHYLLLSFFCFYCSEAYAGGDNQDDFEMFQQDQDEKDRNREELYKREQEEKAARNSLSSEEQKERSKILAAYSREGGQIRDQVNEEKQKKLKKDMLEERGRLMEEERDEYYKLKEEFEEGRSRIKADQIRRVYFEESQEEGEYDERLLKVSPLLARMLMDEDRAEALPIPTNIRKKDFDHLMLYCKKIRDEPVSVFSIPPAYLFTLPKERDSDIEFLKAHRELMEMLIFLELMPIEMAQHISVIGDTNHALDRFDENFVKFFLVSFELKRYLVLDNVSTCEEVSNFNGEEKGEFVFNIRTREDIDVLLSMPLILFRDENALLRYQSTINFCEPQLKDDPKAAELLARFQAAE